MSNKKPIIVCDSDIPFLSAWLSSRCQLIPYQAGALSHEDLQSADALIVRSVTKVDADLVKKTSLRWVGSATAGTNHVDAWALQQAGIAWDYAPGANAPAVCEYVISALWLAQQQGRLMADATIGIVGVGEVGARVQAACKHLGFATLAYDPPRQARDPHFVSAGWEALVACEWVVICAAYTCSGDWPSHQLMDADALSRWVGLRGLINAARGEIVDYEALFAGQDLWTCLDVWPNEPAIDPRWVAQATVATPHIAGYSQQSKWRLSAAIYQACCRFFSWDSQSLSGEPPTGQPALWKDTVGLIATSEQMKAAIANDSRPAIFHQLRKTYPLRSEGG